MDYGIMRVEKRKGCIYGLQLEANRTQDDHIKGRDFDNSDIDWSMTDENVFLKRCDNWRTTITAALKHFGVKERKDSVILLDGLYTASPTWFENKTKSEVMDYFKDCLAFHERTYGAAINAVVHFDEGTPHLAVASVPLIQDTEGKVRLSAKDIMGGRADYRKRQDQFYEEVTKSRGLERGEIRDPSEVKKHLTKREWQNEQLAEIHDLLIAETYPLLHQRFMAEFIKKGYTRGEYGERKDFMDMYNTHVDRQLAKMKDRYQDIDHEIDNFRQYSNDQFDYIDIGDM